MRTLKQFKELAATYTDKAIDIYLEAEKELSIQNAIVKDLETCDSRRGGIDWMSPLECAYEAYDEIYEEYAEAQAVMEQFEEALEMLEELEAKYENILSEDYDRLG